MSGLRLESTGCAFVEWVQSANGGRTIGGAEDGPSNPSPTSQSWSLAPERDRGRETERNVSGNKVRDPGCGDNENRAGGDDRTAFVLGDKGWSLFRRLQ